MAGGRCKHCRNEFNNLGSHEPQCRDRLPWVYKLAFPLARSRIRRLGFDQRTHEGRIFRYAVLRYYVDGIEFALAVLVIVGRVYLWAPFYEPAADSWPLAGTLKLGVLDAFVFGWSILTAVSRFSLISDYRRHVVTRIEKVAARS